VKHQEKLRRNRELRGASTVERTLQLEQRFVPLIGSAVKHQEEPSKIMNQEGLHNRKDKAIGAERTMQLVQKGQWN